MMVFTYCNLAREAPPPASRRNHPEDAQASLLLSGPWPERLPSVAYRALILGPAPLEPSRALVHFIQMSWVLLCLFLVMRG